MVLPGKARFGAAASLLLFVSGAHAESADPPARLVATRDPDADQCPDTEALANAVERIRERPDVGTAPYRVHFSRDGGGFSVSILALPSGRARTLTSADSTCDVIARATAVTLALLFDAEATEARPPSPPPISVPEPPPAPPSSTPPPPRPRRVHGTAGAGVAGLAFVTANVAFAVTGELGLVVSRFRTGLGAAWSPEVATSLGPGEVREGLTTGTARLCYAPIAGDFRLDLCSGADLGRLTARASGFTRDEIRHQLWLAIPLEIAASVWSPGIGVELGAAALVPVKRNDFGVDNLGTAYESKSVGAMLSLRVHGAAAL